ncbi:serine/threonine-protein kinase [Actinomadura sp. BRA 177]|uniref:serine/threonine-protein kinase n=1 Tax=Actinomadura sp. BRA 177 TaxID=2745202 RepID=UPI0015954F22|nr:serine/threonine-protein kinase [Actinomadura sp. BRA 177]NVI90157.1 protein kinase [Actinomadura sp. BRA 177]
MEGAVTSGDRIGHYSVQQTLGEGGMGVVYLGADPEGRNVAIKVLRPAVAGDATARRRLAREVDSMRRVHSPHVAEILDADVTADQPYIVTQYVPGRTLEEVVEDAGPIYGPGLQRLGVGLAAALSAIHGAGIVHRDMKPGNVMLVDGEPVVIDFGIAQAADATRLTATGMVIGTPGYLAPEIIEGEDAGPPSDVHAWAGTVAYAATGRPPFGSGTFESIFYKIMQGTPDLEGVPDALLPVLRSAMARHPAERPTAVNLVQLTRRIHLEATITDQTRVDRHYPAAGAAAAGAAGAAAGTSLDEPAPDHSRMFSMPVTGPPQDSGSQDVPARPTTPGGTGVPAPGGTGMQSPAPVPAQPRDFVGQLPPAAPPPPPPAPPPAQFKAGEQFGQRGYDPYDQGGYPQPYGPPPNQPPPPGALQRGPYDAQTQDAQRRAADQARAGRERADRDRRKPYGWYRVLSFIVLVALLGFANIAPLLALGVTVAGVFVLRAADKAAKGMEGRQTRRGPRSGDALGAAVRTPLHLPGALMSTVLWTSLSLIAGLILLGVLIFAQSDMTASKAIAYSSMAVIGLLCLAPGSGAPRRQLARIWGALLPRAEAALAGALVLGIFAGVLVGLSQRQPPDTTPLDGMSQDLEGLRADVRDLMSGIPGM